MTSTRTSAPKPVAVAIKLTVTVDPASWDASFGTGTAPADVRADVRSYFANHFHMAAFEESGAQVTITMA